MIRPLTFNSGGSAAVEMALTLPILLALLCGSVELGNYFMSEHVLVKAVRDGARYAARQDLNYFTGCSGGPGGTVEGDTKTIVRTGLVSGGTNRFANITDAMITVSVSCSTTAGGTALGGIYTNVKNSTGIVVGAPIVTVSASVPYTPVLQSYGFSGGGYNLNADQQATVIGW